MDDKVPYKAYRQMCTDLDLANVKIERLEKALEFYADKKAWRRYSPNSPWRLLFNSGLLDGDGFLRAQQALKEK